MGRAYAGTGKTHTLELRARAHVEPTLVVYFGAHNAAAAKARMPRHVRSVTGHALAWAATGAKFQHKFKPALACYEIASHPDFPGLFGRPAAAAHVLGVLQLFLWSAADAPNDTHIPTPPIYRKRGVAAAPPLRADDAIACATELWRRMCNPRDASVPATHDALLKKFQLSRPKLPDSSILLDEGQDSNPTILDVLLRQSHASLIVVGDQAQSIYGWRGAVDGLDSVTADAEFRLSQSFRFGPKIARVANAVLASLGETVPLRGLEGMEGMIGAIPAGERELVLARSTSGVVSAAIAAAAAGRSIGFIGGLASYPFDGAQRAWELWRGQRSTTDPLLSGYPDWTEFKDAMEDARDRQGLILVRLVEEYGERLPSLVARVRALAVEDLSQAAVVVATAHRAKGSEADSVRLVDDFPDPLDDEGRLRRGDPQERNLLYVAATRARRRLDPCPPLVGLLDWFSHSSKGAPVRPVVPAPLSHQPVQPAGVR